MKKTPLALLIYATLSVSALADNLPGNENAREGNTYSAVIVKLKAADENARSTRSLQLEAISLPVAPLFQRNDMSRSAMAEMAEMDQRYGFDRYLRIAIPEDKNQDVQYINNILNELQQNSDVELVYPEALTVALDQYRGQTAPASRSSSEFASVPDFRDKQHYAKAPDDKKANYFMGGVNRASVDHYPGHDGAGIALVSAEINPWNQNHLNLPPVSFNTASPVYTGEDHGTASVGIMAAKDLGSGIRGLAWNSRMGYTNASNTNLYNMIPYLKAGDVVQFGVHLGYKNIADCVSECYMPPETEDARFTVIKALTDKGVHVIQAAGNGNMDLDHPYFNGKFDLAKRDSGSILAGAFCANNGQKAAFSTYGTRVTSSSWGCWDVVTTGYGDLLSGQNTAYTAMFSGTSSANPIIAGVVASLSGIAKAHNIQVTPVQMREILHESGTPLANGDSAKIGTHPDMAKAVAKILALKEDDQELVADAGKNFTVTGTAAGKGSRAYPLDGSASRNAVSWTWRIKEEGKFWLQDKEGGQWYSKRSGPQVRALIPENTSGEVTYILEVTNDKDEKAQSEITVTVEQPPQVDHNPAFIAGLNLTVPAKDNGSSVTFSGKVTSTSSATSTPVYHWTLPAGVQGSSPGLATNAFTVNKTTVPQTLQVQVKVTAGQLEKTLKQTISVPAKEVPQLPENNVPAYDKTATYRTACTRVSYNGKVYQNQWWGNPNQEVPGSGGNWGALWQEEKSPYNQCNK